MFVKVFLNVVVYIYSAMLRLISQVYVYKFHFGVPYVAVVRDSSERRLAAV
jgi:hypothetical protein